LRRGEKMEEEEGSAAREGNLRRGEKMEEED
jgi:hypothetical protein